MKVHSSKTAPHLFNVFMHIGMPTTWSSWVAFGLIVLSGVGFRLYHLGSSSLWLDEAHTWFFTRFSDADFLQALRIIGVHPPFYFFLDRIAVSVLGDGEFGLRFLSVLADLSSLLLAVFLGYKTGGKAGALAVGWFWSFNPFTLWYAQDARPYALAALLSISALILYRKPAKAQNMRWMLLPGLVLMLGLITHFYFFLVVGALILLSILQMRKNPCLFRHWTLISILAMIPMLLWLAWFFRLPEPSLGIGWIRAPSLIDPFLTLWNFLSGYAGVFSISSTIFGLLALGLLILGLSRSADARPNRRLFFSGIVLCILGAWMVSFRRPIYVDRYFIVLIPFLIPVLASGAESAFASLKEISMSAWGGAAMIVVFGAAGLFNAWQIHSDGKYAREDWKGLTSQLSNQDNTKPEIWFSYPEVIVPFEYYYRYTFQRIDAEKEPICSSTCYWVLRQPYTATHAFTQSVTDFTRPWLPEIPTACRLLDRWDSPTGIGLWKLNCGP